MARVRVPIDRLRPGYFAGLTGVANDPGNKLSAENLGGLAEPLILVLANSSGAPVTATLESVADGNGRTGDLTITIPARSSGFDGTVHAGPFPGALWNQRDGTVLVNSVALAASLKVYAVGLALSQPEPINASAAPTVDTTTLFLLHGDTRARKDAISGANGNGNDNGIVTTGSGTAKFGAGALTGTTVAFLTFRRDLSTVGSGDFTIEGWFRPTSASQMDLVAVGSDAVGFAGSCVLRMLADRSLRVIFTARVGGAATTFSFPAGVLTLNTYQHVALVRSGSSLTVYVDGVSAGTQTITDPTNQLGLYYANNVCVGGNANNASFWSGQIDEVRISRVVRYTGAFSPPASAFAGDVASDPVLDATTQFLQHFNAIESDEAGGDLLAVDAGATLVAGQFGSALQPGAWGAAWKNRSGLQLGSSDFTLEATCYFTAAPTVGSPSQTVIGCYISTSFNWELEWNVAGTGVGFICSPFNNYTVIDPNPPTLNTPIRYAVTRQGNVWRLFRDGVLVHQQTVATTVNYTAATPLSIGSRGNATPPVYRIEGWVDEVRITVGLARYTANYTPATAPFST